MATNEVENVSEEQLPSQETPQKKGRRSRAVGDKTVVAVNTHFSLFTDYDIDLFKAGKHYHLYNKLGNHAVEHNGVQGIYYAVWAPNARYVSVVGNFNGWDRQSAPMFPRWDHSGIWEVFIPFLGRGEYYKYYI